MFVVLYRHRSGRTFQVYSVRNDSHGYPHFLIYVDGQWKWVSAKHCKPVI